MNLKEDLIKELADGKSNAKTGKSLELGLGLPEGNTNESTRELITECIINDNYPIGSCNRGYFLINTDEEEEEVVNSLESRISGIKKRIEGIKKG